MCAYITHAATSFLAIHFIIIIIVMIRLHRLLPFDTLGALSSRFNAHISFKQKLEAEERSKKNVMDACEARKLHQNISSVFILQFNERTCTWVSRV